MGKGETEKIWCRIESDVLQILSLVKTKWVKNPDYAHANDQLMAIQQDCKLQGITGNIACDAFGRFSVSIPIYLLIAVICSHVIDSSPFFVPPQRLIFG